eukprot:Plantae.Rhodophyta-Palmaria_palmata.ctg6454.p1 GENE.Plantae.Rhodophyta-Palmaria_palmata.ctg6454~~Plantae.Rhodophyta-Palmaria_palmata.ctg6454.p1  ORF type:complete len:323 (+),score=8.35 Plantae.Rhodophyta-Palmaria_palmata.ctg6454:30-998(+)
MKYSNLTLQRYLLVALLSSFFTSFVTTYFHNGVATRQSSILMSELGVEERPHIERATVPLFLVVKTTPQATDRRRVMRETWLRQLSVWMPEARYKFFCEASHSNGSKLLEAEAAEMGDMIIFDDLFQQAHRQIGPKMIRSFEWIEENLKPVHVAMVDDDTYVNVKHLCVDQPTWNNTRTYIGLHMMGQPVIKVEKGKVRVGKYGERYDFPVDKWPRYASGPFYVLSADLLQPFVRPSLPFRQMSSNDGMTGVVLMPFDITYVQKSGLHMWGHRFGKPCIEPSDLYAMHLTPWKASAERGDWGEAVRNLHRDVSTAKCIQAFT